MVRLTLVAIVALGAFLAATNPDKKLYNEHVISKLQDTDCRQETLPAVSHASCHTLRTLPRTVTEPIVGGYSRRQDYLFFSLYTTEFFGLRDRSIGIANSFVELEPS